MRAHAHMRDKWFQREWIALKMNSGEWRQKKKWLEETKKQQNEWKMKRENDVDKLTCQGDARYLFGKWEYIFLDFNKNLNFSKPSKCSIINFSLSFDSWKWPDASTRFQFNIHLCDWKSPCVPRTGLIKTNYTMHTHTHAHAKATQTKHIYT